MNHCRLRATGAFLAVPWLALLELMAQGPGLISGQGTKTPQVSWHGQKKNKNQSQSILATNQASPLIPPAGDVRPGAHTSPLP